MVTTVIEPKSAVALRLERGKTIRVTDLDGTQVADLVAFNAADTSEHFSQGCTRAYNDKATVAVGDHLYSNLNSVMFTVVDDTVGVHDMLFMPCSRYLYENVFGVVGKTGCREHLSSALEPYGIGWSQVTDPFNVFMNTAIDDEGRMRIFAAPSHPGDYFDLRAEMDLIVAVSACAGDTNDCNGGVCTRIGIEVL
jgi:uncharacterized protein YcgI (DUF1989 family)